MVNKIFYGAGKYARDNIERWLANGILPDCFADNDTNKHYTLFKCGEKAFDVLPLSEAIQRFPDAEVYLAVSPENAGTYKSVIACIEKNGALKIKFPDNIEYRKGCPHLGQMIAVTQTGIKTCYCGYFTKNEIEGEMKRTNSFGNEYNVYSGMPVLPVSGDFERDFQNYFDFCEEITDDLRKGLPTACDNCNTMTVDYWPSPPLTLKMQIDSAFGKNYCNFKCHNCLAAKDGVDDDGKRIIEMLIELSRIKNRLISVIFAAGEFTVSPWRHEAMRIIKENGWDIFVITNSSVFDEDIAEMMKHKKATIVTDLSSGTAETFVKVKNAPAFEKVRGNLRKYALTGGKIYLKYIFFDEGINDREIDVDGFVEFASEIGATVQICRDIFASDIPVSERIFSLIERMVLNCKNKNVDIFIPNWFHFHPDSAQRLKNLLES